jgi:hypothetical protein
MADKNKFIIKTDSCNTNFVSIMAPVLKVELQKHTLVLYSFFGTHKCVPNTFLGLFWPTGSYVAHGMRMTVSSMISVLIATPLGLHGGSCLFAHTGHFPHIVTHLIHEYHVNIPWISMPSHGFHGKT